MTILRQFLFVLLLGGIPALFIPACIDIFKRRQILKERGWHSCPAFPLVTKSVLAALVIGLLLPFLGIILLLVGFFS